jgi:hypothetical protein
VVVVQRARPVDDARAPSGPRPLTALSPEETVRYTRLVAAVAGAVEDGLSPGVSANRLAGFEREPPALRFVPWRLERAAFVGRLAEMAESHPCLVFADVRDCYGSIRPEIVEAALAALHVGDSAREAVRGFLDELAGRGVRGLPVGPAPSPVLANAVLTAADRALEGWGVPYLRWVDDVVAAVSDRRSAERVLAGLAAVLARFGLELNASKTRIVLGPAAVELTATVSIAGDRRPVG